MVTYQNAANLKTANRNDTFRGEVVRLAENAQIRDVCDVGGGPNPLLRETEVERFGLLYTLLDISDQQLAKAPAGYQTLLADITDPPKIAQPLFDLVFSQWVAEHVKSGRSFHEGVYGLLKPGGYAVHLFPTLFAIPFVANKILPEDLSYPLAKARVFRPGPKRDRRGNFGKFPAYYRWCFGPTRGQVRRLESVGFEIESYIAFFGHAYYSKLAPLARVEDRLASWLVNYPIPACTSSAGGVPRGS